VFTELDINPQRAKQKPRDIPLYKKANWENIKEDLKSIKNTVKSMKENEEQQYKLLSHFTLNKSTVPLHLHPYHFLPIDDLLSL
jgi:hypothetical protein